MNTKSHDPAVIALEQAVHELKSSALGRVSPDDEARLLDAVMSTLEEIGVQLTARGIPADTLRSVISNVDQYSVRLSGGLSPCTCQHGINSHSTIGCEAEVYRDGGPTACSCSGATGLAHTNDRKYAEREFASREA